MHNVAFPMIKKPEGEDDIRIVFLSQDRKRCLDLHVIDPNGKVHTS